MRIPKKLICIILPIVIAAGLVSTAAFAAGTVRLGTGNYYYNPSQEDVSAKFTYIDDGRDSPFPNRTDRVANVVGDSYESNAQITIKKFLDPVNVDGKSYVCVGFFIRKTSSSSVTDSAVQVHLFENANEIAYTINSNDITESSTSSSTYVYIEFLWQEEVSYTVTYDLKGTLAQDNVEIYPVVTGFKEQGNHSSVAFFTIGNSSDSNKDLRYAGKEEYITDLLAEGAIKQTCPQDGGTVEFPKLERLKTPDESGEHAQTKPYLEVVGFVARVPNSNGGYDYYELTGWKADGDSEATGLYASYDPSADTTLKAQWEKIELSAKSSAPDNILLQKDNGTQTYLKLAQKTSGQDGFVTADTPTAADGVIDYQVSMNLNGVFADRKMPWYATTYFKNIDDPAFAELHLTVKLDSNLELVKDDSGKTEITSDFEGFKIKDIKIGSETVTPQAKEDAPGTYLVDLNGAQGFTINYEWNTENTSVEMRGMTVTIPTKVKDDATATTITGTTATITGSFDFTKAHTVQNTHTDKAVFEADQFVRYYLSLNEAFFNAYGGDEMTLKNMLQAAKDIQEGLKNIEETSNSLTATVSERVSGLTLDKPTITVNVNGSETVQPIFDPDTVTNKAVTWSVEAGKEAIVRVENGVITGLKPGTATVTCTSVYDPTKKADVTVTVNGVVYVEPTTGGTVSVSGTGVDAITGTDNAYSVAENATVTVTVTGTLAGNTPSVYYYNAEGAKEPVTVSDGGTTFTFTMPSESPVYVSAAFVIQNGSGNTVVSESKTEVTDSTTKYTDSKKIDVEMSTQAVNEMLDAINKEGQGQKYNVAALEEALENANITTAGPIYRHIQTKADITVDKYPTSTGQGTGTIELNIKFQYRVVASTQADPDSLQVKDDLESSTSTVPNAAVVGDGWTEYESREDTYIVVPIPQFMGMPGDWIKATHTHTNANQTTTEYKHNLQVQNDQTVSYPNSHEEGYSPFTFEARRGVKDLRFENASGRVDIGTFDPDKLQYSGQVSIDVESINFTPDFMHSETGGVNTLNGTATLMVNGDEVYSVSSGLPTYTVNLKEGNNTLTFTYVVGSTVDQTYTISIYRGARPVPPSPSTYTVKTEEVENATVETSASSARAGETVTVTVTPAESYHVSGVTVTAANGAAVEVKENEDGTYTFTMPASNVTVTATVYKCPSLAYTDLDVTQWYHPYVDYAITHDLMEGVGDGVFAPEKTVTRAQMAGILWNLEGQPVVNYLMTFTDVPDGKWYTEAIRWAASEGIISGFGDGTFRPEDTITREQMAAMLYFYEQKLGSGGFTGDWEFNLTFDDAADISPWAREAVAWCTMKGVITGSDNKFNPSGSSKRAHLATILALYDQLENN